MSAIWILIVVSIVSLGRVNADLEEGRDTKEGAATPSEGENYDTFGRDRGRTKLEKRS